MQIKTQEIHTNLGEAVRLGFSKKPKSISSMFLYDAEGDRLFQEIMKMPEYYLTRCEEEIFHMQKEQILKEMQVFEEPFNLMEFGAGDGSKTKILLHYLLENGADFTYYPVDISKHILSELAYSLQQEMPALKVHPMNFDYFDAIRETTHLNNRRNITLFLGSNMGNFTREQAVDFYKNFARESKTGNLLFVGIDRRKNPHIISQAYDDPHGITAAFNLNLLRRMNREMGADFDMEAFRHYSFYEPVSGEVRSYLISLKDQQVYFETLEEQFFFKKDELIHTEISKKYSPEEIDRLAEEAGYKVLCHFTDERQYFLDSLWEVP